MEYFGEENFQNKMDTVVAPFMRINLKEGTFKGYDGHNIAYAFLKNPKEKAAIVISHGFCEFIKKYEELMYYMYQAGYSVFFVSHRGHGYSYREIPEDLSRVHVNDFSEYVEDFNIFINNIVIPASSTRKLFLFAHSMGGAIGARYLELYPETFEKAVLSSPMIEMCYGKMSFWMVKATLFAANILGWNRRYIAGQGGFDGVYKYESSCCQSKARYDYGFNARVNDVHYQSYGGTYGWIAAGVKVSEQIKEDANRVITPVLMLQAGKDTLVQSGAQRYFAEKSQNTRLVLFENSKHEIFNAFDQDRIKFYEMIFDFWDNKI